ncbi:Glycoside hydrolase, family 43 [Fusarium oxysporum f. sp. vasinfectum]|nr:Glycoside hydrolase, family 43 [Fusarium oxysporum f. sp. vasinfectum]
MTQIRAESIARTNVEHIKPGNTNGAWGIDNPLYFDFHGIDPDLFFDDNGRVYVSGSSWNSNPSTINCFEINLVTGEKLTPERTIWGGFSKIIPEGPHIYKRGEWYYLLDAEGGTHEGHRLAMARSQDIFGPYEQCPHNPILRPQSQDDKPYVCWAGHGDLIQDPKGAWWLFCLAARSDKQGRCGLGRETFLTSVVWPSDESWPEIAQPITLSLPDKLLTREPVPQKADPRHEPLWIRNIDLTAFEPISFVGKRQRNLQGMISVNLSLSQSIGGTRMKAGLTYYKDEHRIARVYFKLSTVSVWTDVRNSGRRPSILRNREVAKLD